LSDRPNGRPHSGRPLSFGRPAFGLNPPLSTVGLRYAGTTGVAP
jgi:hypothetical protein